MKLRKITTSLVYLFLGLPALAGSVVTSQALSPSEQAAPSNFRELSLPAKNFSVLFPDQPKESKELFESEDGQVSVVIFQGYYLPGQYLVMVADYPLEFDTPLKVKTAFDSFLGRTLANRGSEIISQREIKLGTYPGHEVKIRSGDSIVKARMYAVRNRVYSLMLITQLDTMQEPWDSLRFFESLQLTGEWAPSAETEIYRAKSWRFFPEPAEGISVWLPVEAGIDTFYADSAPDFGTYHLLVNHDGVIYWLLRMQTSGVTQNRTDLRKSLPGLGQFWSEMLDVKIEGVTPIEVNGLHGLSYRIKRGPLTGHARIFLMKDSFVSLWSWPSKPHDSVDDEALFVNSFKPIEVQPGETFDPKARDRAGGPPPPPQGVGSSSMPTKKISTAQLLANVIERGEMESWYPASLANAFGVIDLEITVSQDGRVVNATGAGGHALLWEKAAWSALSLRFKPFKMKGKPVAAGGRLPIVYAMTDPRPNEAFKSRAISKAEPEYPKTAKAARTQGIVSVQVSVSGDGNVISASAFNGPSQLRKAAENAARKWVFRPIEIFGERRQTWGVLTFNFRLPN